MPLEYIHTNMHEIDHTSIEAGLMKASQWSPQHETVSRIFQLLHANCSPFISNQDRSKVFQELNNLEHSFPELSNYLVLIFAEPTSQALTTEIRHTAGLLLKNVILRQFDRLPVYIQEYLKHMVLKNLKDQHETLRRTSGTIISAIVAKHGISSWPSLFTAIIEGLDSTDETLIDGAFDALLKLCEDVPHLLSSPDLSTPFNAFFPILIRYIDCPNDNFRSSAFACLKQFWIYMPPMLEQNILQIVSVFLGKGKDRCHMIRQSICQSFVVLFELRFESLLTYFKPCTELMCLYLSDNDEIAADACQFFICYCERPGTDLKLLWPLLPRLLPELLDRMKLGDYDLALLEDEDDADDVPDESKDIKPQFHSKTTRDDEEDEILLYSMRKTAARTLDTLALSYRSQILPILLPLLELKYSSNDFLQTESAILALGAISNGCADGLRSHLGGLVVWIVQILCTNEMVPVRTIACWTLGRYASFVAREDDNLDIVMATLFKKMKEKSKLVQRSACTAVAEFFSTGPGRMSNYLDTFLQVFVDCFYRYQTKNLNTLYDTLSECSESLGSSVKNCRLGQSVLPLLIDRWLMMPEDDTATFHLMECIGFVCKSVEEESIPFASDIFDKCIHIASAVLESDCSGFDDTVDPEFAICALDLLSSLMEGLQTHCEPILQSKSGLLQVIYKAMDSNSADLRQSSIAVFGEIVQSVRTLQIPLAQFIPPLCKCMDHRHPAVCTNASWALGLIVMQESRAISPFVDALVDCVADMFLSPDANKGLVSNLSITLGRISLQFPNNVGAKLFKCFRPWCMALAQYQNDQEKLIAFQGMLRAISAAPESVIEHTGAFILAVGMWRQLPPPLEPEIRHILSILKHGAGDHWFTVISQCPSDLRESVLSHFGI